MNTQDVYDDELDGMHYRSEQSVIREIQNTLGNNEPGKAVPSKEVTAVPSYDYSRVVGKFAVVDVLRGADPMNPTSEDYVVHIVGIESQDIPAKLKELQRLVPSNITVGFQARLIMRIVSVGSKSAATEEQPLVNIEGVGGGQAAGPVGPGAGASPVISGGGVVINPVTLVDSTSVGVQQVTPPAEGGGVSFD